MVAVDCTTVELEMLDCGVQVPMAFDYNGETTYEAAKTSQDEAGLKEKTSEVASHLSGDVQPIASDLDAKEHGMDDNAIMNEEDKGKVEAGVDGKDEHKTQSDVHSKDKVGRSDTDCQRTRLASELDAEDKADQFSNAQAEGITDERDSKIRKTQLNDVLKDVDPDIDTFRFDRLCEGTKLGWRGPRELQAVVSSVSPGVTIKNPPQLREKLPLLEPETGLPRPGTALLLVKLLYTGQRSKTWLCRVVGLDDDRCLEVVLKLYRSSRVPSCLPSNSEYLHLWESKDECVSAEQEAAAYHRLQELQGTLIPHCYGFWSFKQPRGLNRVGLVMVYIRGVQASVYCDKFSSMYCNSRSSTMIYERLLEIYTHIHTHFRMLHRSIAGRNILVLNRNNDEESPCDIVIIDFERCLFFDSLEQLRDEKTDKRSFRTLRKLARDEDFSMCTLISKLGAEVTRSRWEEYGISGCFPHLFSPPKPKDSPEMPSELKAAEQVGNPAPASASKSPRKHEDVVAWILTVTDDTNRSNRQ